MAIYPNSRGFGYAVFKGATTPKDCGIVTIRPISNSKNLERISNLLDYFKPEILILQGLEKMHSHKSSRVKKLLNKINQLALSVNIDVVRISRIQIRDVFIQFGAKSKYEIAHTIANWLPQFKTKLPRYRKPWMAEDYHQVVFDAISLILTYYYLEE